MAFSIHIRNFSVSVCAYLIFRIAQNEQIAQNKIAFLHKRPCVLIITGSLYLTHSDRPRNSSEPALIIVADYFSSMISHKIHN